MRTLLAMVLVLMPVLAAAQDATGLWRTETSDEGAYLHVRIAACSDDAGKRCGHIVKVFNNDATGLVGKPIIWGMAADGAGRWSGGRIWAPDDDKTYRSKMALQGGGLRVEGCVAIFCRGQTWTRVN